MLYFCLRKGGFAFKMKKNKKDKCASSQQKKDKLHGVMKSLQLPVGALPDCTHFEMNGNREVIIEGSKGILQYDESVVKVNMGCMITSFYGRKLSIKCFDTDSLIIEGFIVSIEFMT